MGIIVEGIFSAIVRSQEIATAVLIGGIFLVAFLAWHEIKRLKHSTEPPPKVVETEKVVTPASTVAVTEPPKRRTNPAFELAKSEAKDDCCKSKQEGKSDRTSCGQDSHNQVSRVVVMYGTTTGNSTSFAQQLNAQLLQSTSELEIETIDVASIEPEDHLVALANDPNACLVLIISTYTEGTPPEAAKWFYTWLEESAKDFRVQHSMLKGLKYAVFGLGNSLYSDHYNVVGKQVDKFLFQLSATRFHSLGLGDENVAGSKYGSMEADFEKWSTLFVQRVEKWNGVGVCKEGKADAGDAGGQKTSDFDTSEDEGEEESSPDVSDNDEEEDDLVDLEDLGKVMKKATLANKKGVTNEPKEMITPLLRKSLTKQGYKLIGSHSGVKICRWTKAMLRGRGGCYKHTFYGIESHRCMETTPSLACANKCVFCWRHHSNPVGTEWKWKMDPAETVLEGALENHYKMIKQMKGVPGVLPEKLDEGMKVQHCALSLVGEPIMYPEINKFVRMLHEKGISSFLVTNAQFPDAIRDMEPCTQLYVSIDASTKDALKAIDRPLHKDFWERFLASLKELAAKGQRTVYRLTLVKGWNAEEIRNYANLVSIGNPDFIEIKGVTYCGTSKASKLTMDNVPWHEEVVHFVGQLAEHLNGDYQISCEHEHSNCVLLTHKRFCIDGKWKTWIDYPKFHQLVQNYNQTGQTFSATDYMSETPSWAVFGSSERGFDPEQTRFHRNRNKNNKVTTASAAQNDGGLLI